MDTYDYDFFEVVDSRDWNTVSVDDIDDILHSVSLDMVSGTDTLSQFNTKAVTYLYSGNAFEGCSARTLASKFQGARTLDKTEAAYLLNDKGFKDMLEVAFKNDIKNGKFTLDNVKDVEKGIRYDTDLNDLKDILGKSNMTDADIQRAAEIATSGYMFEPEKGAWATVSERFVEATPSTSRIECITNHADLNRTWAVVEVNTAVEKLSDSHQIGQTTVGELRKLKADEGMDAVYQKLMADSDEMVKNTTLYFDDNGNIVGASNSVSHYSGKSSFEKSIDDYSKFATDAEMLKRCPEYGTYGKLDQIKIRNNAYELDNMMKDVKVSDDVMQEYLKKYNKLITQIDSNAPVKGMQEVTDADRLAAALMKNSDNGVTASKLENFAKSYRSPDIKGAVFTAADIVMTVYEIYDTTSRTVEYIKNGDYEAATKTVYEGIATESVGYLMSYEFLPAFISVGSCFGPVGAAIGGILGGIACYTIAGEVAQAYWCCGEILADLWIQSRLSDILVYDPLILDMDGNGIDVLSRKNGAYFDLNCDGFAEKVNWTGTDAILSLDLNENGKIDNGREVFGDYHLLADGNRASGGFEALEQYDTDDNGIIDEQDEVFDKLRLWIDSDADGVSAEGELKTLKETGIAAISLNYSASEMNTGTEAVIGNTAAFIYEDNTEGLIGELWVSSDLYDSMESVSLNIAKDTKGLPNVRSYGKINSLHTAMELDKTGELKELVQQFADNDDISERLELTKQILDVLCDTASITDTKTYRIELNKLKVIESFMGEDFIGVNGSKPNQEAAKILEKMYEKIVENYCFSMIGSEHSAAVKLFETNQIEARTASWSVHMMLMTGQINEQEFSDICAYLSFIGKYSENAYSDIAEFRNYFKENAPEYLELIENSMYGALKTTADKCYISGNQERAIAFGDDRNNDVRGIKGGGFILGYGGNDILGGSDGNDYIEGGTGDDRLSGSMGADIYHFDLGWGNDTIDNRDISTGRLGDTIEFGKGILPEDLTFTRKSYDMVITHKNGDTITLYEAYYHSDGRSMIENVVFADRTKWNADDIKAKVRESGINGNETANIITGESAAYMYDLNEKLYGYDGDDCLVGYDGDDYLDGGAGNDRLQGCLGADTYHFDLGWGADIILNSDKTDSRKDDVIEFGEGIIPEDLSFSKEGYDMLILNTLTGDTIRIWEAYKPYSNDDYKVDNVRFANGITASIDYNNLTLCDFAGGGENLDTMCNIQANLLIQDMNGLNASENISAVDTAFSQSDTLFTEQFSVN